MEQCELWVSRLFSQNFHPVYFLVVFLTKATKLRSFWPSYTETSWVLTSSSVESLFHSVVLIIKKNQNQSVTPLDISYSSNVSLCLDGTLYCVSQASTSLTTGGNWKWRLSSRSMPGESEKVRETTPNFSKLISQGECWWFSLRLKKQEERYQCRRFTDEHWN